MSHHDTPLYSVRAAYLTDETHATGSGLRHGAGVLHIAISSATIKPVVFVRLDAARTGVRESAARIVDDIHVVPGPAIIAGHAQFEELHRPDILGRDRAHSGVAALKRSLEAALSGHGARCTCSKR